MYKEKKSMIRSGHPLLTGICMAIALLCGCGEEAAPASAPAGQEKTDEENAAGQREKELTELTAGETSLSVDELSDYAMDVALTYDAELKKGASLKWRFEEIVSGLMKYAESVKGN